MSSEKNNKNKILNIEKSEDPKDVALALFDSQKYKKLFVKLFIKNVTSRTEITDLNLIKRNISSVKIGESKTLELHEIGEDYALIGSTLQIGSLGHILDIKVSVFEDQNAKKPLFAFKSYGKIEMFERKTFDNTVIFIMRFQFQKGDKKYWDELAGIFTSKQLEINHLFNKLRGIEE
jgi:hypothetical protein